MKIRPLNSTNKTFKADTVTIDPLTGDYKDPLMHWPLRGAAFTNEVGEALRPIIGNYATLSWAPALLYIGADIYDKYKNDKTEYSPNSKRCLKQAIFQGLASIALPLVAVKAGQKLFSLLGKCNQNKLSFESEEKIIKLAQEFVANGNMRAYKNKDEECVVAFVNVVKNSLDYHNNTNKMNSVLKKFFDLKIENSCINIEKYSKQTVKELISIRKDLLSPSEEFKSSNLYKNYQASLNGGQTKNVAVKSVLHKYLNEKTVKGKSIMTIGGFLALGIAIKPIDRFVENVLIGKVIEPKLNKKETII